MSRKKDATPDMFTAEAPAKKEKATVVSRNTAIALADGNIAGIPTSCADADVALRDIVKRCQAAILHGVLTDAQAVRVRTMERAADSALEDVRCIRQTAEALSHHAEKKPAEMF